MVVDERTRWDAETGRDDEAGARPERALRDEGVRVHDGEVVEFEARPGESVVDRVGVERPVREQKGAGGRDDDVLRGRSGLAGGRGAGEQRAVEVGRDGALLGREVDVARAHGQAVRLAQRRHAGDLDRQVEVAHEAADDGELLRVLLAEEQHVRLHHAEQLGDDDGDAVEVARARGALEALGERAADVDVGGEALRIHLVGRRREDDRDARLLQEAQVAGLVARVLVEVLAAAELRRVHEDGGGDARAAPTSPPRPG